MAKEQKKKPPGIIKASFNIFDSGWKKFGNHRKYITENVDRTVNGEIAQERVVNRAMLGFFGHRSNAPLEPNENVDNLASHVTTELKFYPSSGDVRHTQEILDTRPGRAVLGLHESRVGNFSWRGEAKGGIMADNNQFSDNAARHLRFDYVYVPGMVKQPRQDGFISEGVEESPELQKLLENCLDAGLTRDEALSMLDDWQRRGIFLEESTNSHDIMSMELHLTQKKLADILKGLKNRRDIVEEAIKSSHYVLKKDTMDFLSGVRKVSETDEVMEAVSEILTYSNVSLGNRFPGGPPERRKLPEGLFSTSDRKRKLRQEDFLLGSFWPGG